MFFTNTQNYIKERVKSISFITIGFFNLMHASLHIFQFLQSILLISSSTSHEHHDNEGFLEHLMHNPYVNIIWAIIGITTLYLGIKDFIHHKKCKH